MPFFGCFSLQLVEHALEAVAVFGEVDGVGRGAEDRHIGRFQRAREFQRGLAAELHDDAMQRAVLAFGGDDFQHVFGGQRLEIQPVGGVVVGRHRFRVAVDHDGFIAGVMQREAGMAAAVIELDALADPVRSAAEDDDLLRVGRRAFVGQRARERRLIGRIHIGGGRGELGRAGVDALEHRANPERLALRRHLGLGGLGQHRQPRVGKAHRLQGPHAERMRGQAALLDLAFHLDDAAHLGEEPGIDLAGGEDLLVAPAEPHRLRDLQQAVRRRRAQGGADRVLVVAAAEAFDLDFVEPGQAGLEAAQRLLQAFLEGAADRHHFADRLHRGRQRGGGAGKFFERKARNFGDDVIDGRLERRRRRAAGDVVGDFVERVADREFGGDLGDRKAGRLRGQRRGARHPRVHLDHDHAAVGRIDAELHVGAAGLDADLAQHRQRGVAHDLVFLVGQGQRRRHRDGIAGMHAHRIEVLDRADDDAVVLLVAHHLHLELFPAEHGFLDQDFVGGRGVDAAFDDLDEFRLGVGDAAAGAAHGEGGADDGGQADLVERAQRVRQVLGLDRARRLQPDPGHGLAKTAAVFRLVDGVGGGADHLDVELCQRALLAQRQRAVQRGLAAHGRQQRKTAGKDVAFLFDDLGDDFRRDRLDIGGVGQFRIGHDGGRIGIDQDDAVALFLQGLDRLGAGIVEFAGLADHDGTGADDQDGGDVGSFGHQVSAGAGNWAQKKGAPVARPSNPALGINLARGWSLDQIPHPRKGLKGPINRHFSPALCGLWRGSPSTLSLCSSYAGHASPFGLQAAQLAEGRSWRPGLDLNQDKEHCTAPASTLSATGPRRSSPITPR